MEQESSAAFRDEPNPQYLTVIEAQKSSDFRENEEIPGRKRGHGPPQFFRRCKKAIAVLSLSCCFVSIPVMVNKALPPRTENAGKFSELPKIPVSDTSVSGLRSVTVFKNGKPDSLSEISENRQEASPICSVLEVNSAALSDVHLSENRQEASPICSVLEVNSAEPAAMSESSETGQAISEVKSADLSQSSPLSELSEKRQEAGPICSVLEVKSTALSEASETGQAKPEVKSAALSQSPERVQTKSVRSVSRAKAAAYDPFPVSKRLKKRVDFWIKVFGSYTSDQIVIYDSRYAGVVYEVIDTASPEFQEQRDKGDISVEMAKQKYEQLLSTMPWDSPQSMTREQRRLYSLYKHIPGLTEEAMKNASNRVLTHRGLANTFKAAIIRAGAYIDAMKQILAEHNLPEDLVYLTLIESKFNPYALSYMGAAGVWQFMPRTGKHYNLTINGLIDERRDPVLSTRAAALLLDHNYKLLKSWPLAVTAYNHGVKGVRNAIESLNSEDIADIVENYDGPRFEFASRNFYAEFLAAREVATRYKEYFKDIEVSRPQTVEAMKLSDHIAAQTLEQYFEIPIDTIREMNPALDDSVFIGKNFIPKEYPLNVPAHRKEEFEHRYKTIPAELKYDYVLPQIKYRVRRGQTLSNIARSHNCSVKEFMRLNGIVNPRRIRVGQWLNIPGQYLQIGGETPDEDETASVTDIQVRNDGEMPDEPVSVEIRTNVSAETGTNHRVRKGQTLGRIARLYNTSPKAIIKLNSIKNPQHIRAGQMLRIPEG